MALDKLRNQYYYFDGTILNHYDETKTLHREGGPAAEYADGAKYWYLNDELHREDGPAIEYADGTKIWYLNGVEYTEEEYHQEMNRVNSLSNILKLVDPRAWVRAKYQGEVCE